MWFFLFCFLLPMEMSPSTSVLVPHRRIVLMFGVPPSVLSALDIIFFLVLIDFLNNFMLLAWGGFLLGIRRILFLVVWSAASAIFVRLCWLAWIICCIASYRFSFSSRMMPLCSSVGELRPRICCHFASGVDCSPPSWIIGEIAGFPFCGL